MKELFNTFSKQLSLSVIIFAIVILGLIVGFSIHFVVAWTSPTANPPSGNLSAPINVSSTTQTKAGVLNLASGLQVSGVPVIDNGAGWHRTYGQSGWYNGTYHGGWYMADDIWVRSYIDKSVYTGGQMRADSGFNVDGLAVIDDGAGWHRTYGQTGWYNNTYGGGWWMTDYTWLRAYNDKSVYTTGQMRADSGFCIGASCITSWPAGGTSGGSCYTKCAEGGRYCSATVSCASGYTAIDNWCEMVAFDSEQYQIYNNCIACCK